MTEPKGQILRQLEQKAHRRVAELSTVFARAKSEDKEEILAEIEFQRDMANMCDLCLD